MRMQERYLSHFFKILIEYSLTEGNPVNDINID